MTDYQIVRKIYESNNSLVYRAILKPGDRPVVLKILKENYPTPSELNRYKQEYEVTRSLNTDGVIKAYDLQRYENSLVMFLEDFGGESLKLLMRDRQFTLAEFLSIAIETTQSLADIHAANIIHKDINPSNIIYNPTTKQLKIIDFGIATFLPRENQTIDNLDRIEGTLAYIAPEQTGRMNRGIDYRCDFYALGATFYELLTGKLPFTTSDSIELVHCHIAQQPIPPSELVETSIPIPQAVSDIAMKLLAKTPEERYQSALGIKADLEICLDRWQSLGKIDRFALGERDICDRFHIPEKLYGREKEVAELLTTFERVSQGSAEIILVSGYSGIGKSALINEIHKPIVRQRGYFISGKFDQLKRDIPYGAIALAFKDLIRQLLSESETALQTWKQELLTALEPNSRVIIDIIPEVEQIIGEQEIVEPLGAIEAQNRFNLFFQKFIGVFAKKEHPLVIFLDDLQWADLASLKLIELLITDRDRQYLLVVGAYRNNEVDETHPLSQTFTKITKKGAKTNNIWLQPLALECLNQLIADTLNCSIDKSKSLAELITSKTQGNPFFSTQLLQFLHKQNLLLFDCNKNIWQWNIEDIKRLAITDNVVELTIGKISQLDEETQKILQLAACIGNQFNLKVLSVVNNISETSAARQLQPALEEGLILPQNNGYKIPLLWEREEISRNSSKISDAFIPKIPECIPYKFLHDRVQQAAYALIPEAEKKAVHLQVGRLLLENIKDDELDDNIFDIVKHLDRGSELITHPSERYRLARLNLRAGKKAKASAAYEPALKYLETALIFLPINSWIEDYKLTLEIYGETLEGLYLNANYDRVEQLAPIVLQETHNSLDRVKAYESLLLVYYANFNPQKVIDNALEYLAQLGVHISQKDNNSDFKNRIIQEQNFWKLLAKVDNIEDLANLPIMTAPDKLVALQILQHIFTATSTTKFALHIEIILVQLDLFMKYGNAPQAPAVYSFYGALMCGLVRDIEVGYEFGKLAIKLQKKSNIIKLEPLINHLCYGCIFHWKEFLRNTVAREQLLKGYQIGLDTGNNEYAGYSLISFCLTSFFAGFSLTEVESNYVTYSSVIEKMNIEYSIFYIKVCEKIVINLRREKENKLRLFSQHSLREEEEILSSWRQMNNEWLLFIAEFCKTISLYIFKDYAAAYESGIKGKKYVESCLYYLPAPQHNFYSSLAFIGHYHNSDIKGQKQILEQIGENQNNMRMWAAHCPENFQNKYDLVEAERARVLGQNWQAQELYEKAIQGAKKSEFIHEEAIAYERAAEFYFSISRQEIGQFYLRNAHHCYSRWGATAKVKQLEAEYPEYLLGITDRSKSTLLSTTTSTTGSDGQILDLNTILKASQAISGEISLEKLLQKLMKIAIENAGAQKGFLILERDRNWFIEAQGAVDAEDVRLLRSLAIDSIDPNLQTPLLSASIVNYVARTQESLVLNDAANEGQFIQDPYIVAAQPKSILCTPLIDRGKLSGILYLENNLTTGAFTSDRLEVLKILSAQAAISLENARLYVELGEKEQRLTQFLEAIPIGVFALNAKGESYYANRTAQQILGKGIAAETTSDRLSEIYKAYITGTDQLYPTERQPIVRALKGESSTVDDLEIRQEGRTIPLEVSATPVFDERGEIVYAIAAFQDITQRRQAETERIEFTQELARKNVALQRAKDELQQYSQTLENRVIERTEELSQTLEILKATQAELLFENELLRSNEPLANFDYQVGGSLPMDAPTYIVRAADRYLYKALKRGEFCYVLNPRQMGKSSLMVRMVKHLQHEGVRCAAIDLTRIGSERITPDQWYKGIAFEIGRCLGLPNRANLKAWWQERADLSAVQRLSQFIAEILLVESGDRSNLVIFIDEVDSVLGLKFPVNDFFGLLRSCYNQRSLNPEYNRLTFALFGVAAPSDLIANSQTSPFNIGQSIRLEGFKESEARPLLQGLSDKVSHPQRLLKEVLAWTNGQPFLTQKLCESIRSSSSPIPDKGEAEWVENLVREKIVDNWESQDEPEHLRTIRDRLLYSPQSVRLLELYRQVLGEEAIAPDSLIERELLLSGLIIKRQGLLRVNNRIYESIFDRSWLDRSVGL